MHSFWFGFAFVSACIQILAPCNGLVDLRTHEDDNLIRTPWFPHLYLAHQDIEWRIVGPNPESRITLTFSVIDIEKPKKDTNGCFDYILVTSIYDDGIRESCSKVYCGKYISPEDIVTVESKTNMMKILFHSDGYLEGRGFNATFSISHTEVSTTTMTPTTKRLCTDEEYSCSNSDCIPLHKFCDGNNDCDFFAEDENCWRAPWSVQDKESSLEKAGTWLSHQFKRDFGWGGQTHRAIIALALGNRTLNIFDPDERSMYDERSIFAKQLEVQMLSLLLRNESINADQLALNIFALCAACFEPQNFYGTNLTEKLINQDVVEKNMNPLTPLAICISNVDISEHYLEELEDYLRMNTSSHFNLDLKSLSLIALACVQRRGQELSANVSQLISATLEHFKTMQQEDGSFGDLVSSALIGQALNALRDNGRRWDYSKLISFLKSQQSESGVLKDISATYLSIPVIAGRSVVDILDVECQKKGKRSVTASSTRQIYYSVWIGENKDKTQTISLTYRYDPSITIFDLIKMASDQDSKFKAMWKIYYWGPIIYSINGVSNQPEEQKYWRLFELDNDHLLERYHQRLDRIYPEDSQHYVMWFV